jgi:hypothetical protein
LIHKLCPLSTAIDKNDTFDKPGEFGSHKHLLTVRSTAKSIRSAIEIIEVTVLCHVYLDIITHSQNVLIHKDFISFSSVRMFI